MAGRKRGLVELAGVPRTDEHPPAGGLLADKADRLAQLVDAPTVGCRPVAPLLSVIPARVTWKTRAPLPVVGERVAIPDVHAQRVEVVHVRASREEPQKLGHHRPEGEPLRRNSGESTREVEAHHLAEHRAGADPRAVGTLVTLFERLTQDVEVLAHG